MVSRDGDTGVTTYELAFAIVDLLGTSTEHAGQWKEGLRFGFSFLVNEGSGAQLGWVGPTAHPLDLRARAFPPLSHSRRRIATPQAGYYPHSMVHGWNGGQKEPGKTGVVQLAAPQDGAADCLSLNFELDAETECPAGWECEGQAQVHRNGHPITGPCTQSECSFGNVLTYHGLGQQGDQYLYLGGATSPRPSPHPQGLATPAPPCHPRAPVTASFA